MGENLLSIPRLIEPGLWGKADLAGVAFLTPPAPPPGLGLIFRDAAAAAAIFRGWRDGLGASDVHELLRVAIIEGELAGKPPGYTLTLGLDQEQLATALRDGAYGGVDVDMSGMRSVRRRMNTPPGGSPPLASWKRVYASAGSYALVPVVDRGQGFEPLYDLQLVKRRLLLRSVSDIAAGDPDAWALA